MKVSHTVSPTFGNSANIAKRIANSPRTQKVLKYAHKNPTLFNSMFVFTLAMILKPVSIMFTPTPKEDKVYSIARSLSTGIADLGIVSLFYIPLNKGIRKAGDRLFKSSGTIYHNNAKKISQYKSLFNRGFKLALLPAFAFLKFFFIDDIADKIAKTQTTTKKTGDTNALN